MSKQQIPVLISTPHSSFEVPKEILAEMLLSGESESSLKRRILKEGDPHTDQIFSVPEATATFNAVYSRFVVDLNRKRNEGGENGVIKLMDFNRQPFYSSSFVLTDSERERRLKLYYDPYHNQLEKLFTQNKFKFFIDGHSMTSLGPALGPDEKKNRPAICIGNFGDLEGEKNANPEGKKSQNLSCSPQQARFIQKKLEILLSDFLHKERLPLAIALNQPFDGGAIVKKFSNPPYSIPGILLEVNRALYFNEDTLLPIPGRLRFLNEVMGKLVKNLI